MQVYKQNVNTCNRVLLEYSAVILISPDENLRNGTQRFDK